MSRPEVDRLHNFPFLISFCLQQPHFFNKPPFIAYKAQRSKNSVNILIKMTKTNLKQLKNRECNEYDEYSSYPQT